MTSNQPSVYVTQSEVDWALDHYLGLPLSVVEEAAVAWGSEVVSGNRFRPQTAPGFAGWDRGTEVAREGAHRFGYDPVEFEGISLAVHRGRNVALCLVAGSDGAGDPARTPTTRHPRGAVGQSIVEAQSSFFFSPATTSVTRGTMPHWYLLPYFSSVDGRVWYEISHPAILGPDARVAKWHTRIIPPSVEPFRRRQPAPEMTEEIDIPVKRR